jgi:hypothetical protein
MICNDRERFDSRSAQFTQGFALNLHQRRQILSRPEGDCVPHADKIHAPIIVHAPQLFQKFAYIGTFWQSTSQNPFANRFGRREHYSLE